VIEDLEGATTEPSRRTHVAVLSASVAAVSLVLLYALLVPAEVMDTRQLAASPASSLTNGTRVVILASDSPHVWFPGASGEVRFGAPPSNDMTATVCVTAAEANPTIPLMVFDRTGQPIAAYTGWTTERVPLPQVYVGSGWRTVPCPKSDVLAPRINRAR
jgi:hypothetical protein